MVGTEQFFIFGTLLYIRAQSSSW